MLLELDYNLLMSVDVRSDGSLVVSSPETDTDDTIVAGNYVPADLERAEKIAAEVGPIAALVTLLTGESK